MAFDLRIHFAGLILYVVDKSLKHVAVILPDCRVGATPARQADGDTKPAPHAGYIRFDFLAGGKVRAPGIDLSAGQAPSGFGLPKPFFEVVRLFEGEDLDLGLPNSTHEIGGLSKDDGTDPDDELLLPKVEKFADTLRLNADLFTKTPQGVLMRMLLKGGTFDSRSQGRAARVETTLNSHAFEYVKPMANSVIWTRRINRDNLEVKLTSFDGLSRSILKLKPVIHEGKKTIDLRISNLCSDNPLEWAEFGVPVVTTLEDKDFKWLYQLLHPADKTYTQALNGKMLPVPVLQDEGSTGDLILCYGNRMLDEVPTDFISG